MHKYCKSFNLKAMIFGFKAKNIGCIHACKTKKHPPPTEGGGTKECRHGLRLPDPYGPSNSSVQEGDDRVRDGNGSTLPAQRTDKSGGVKARTRGLHNFRGRPILTD